MCLASAPLFQPKHLHPSVLYIRMPCIVSFELHHCFKTQRSTEPCSLPKFPSPFPKVSVGLADTASLLNITGNYLREKSKNQPSHRPEMMTSAIPNPRSLIPGGCGQNTSRFNGLAGFFRFVCFLKNNGDWAQADPQGIGFVYNSALETIYGILKSRPAIKDTYPSGILSLVFLAACPPAERGGAHLWSAEPRAYLMQSRESPDADRALLLLKHNFLLSHQPYQHQT